MLKDNAIIIRWAIKGLCVMFNIYKRTDNIIDGSMDRKVDRKWVWSVVSFFTTLLNSFN